MWPDPAEVTEITLLSKSPEETRALAARLGELLEPGDLVALTGELGAGKTEFVRGLAEGLNIPPELVASPSFALVHHYPGPKPLVHVDLYRLGALPEDFMPELEEYLGGPRILAVEWAERLGPLLPPAYLEVELEIADDTERRLRIRGHGPRGEEVAAALKRALS